MFIVLFVVIAVVLIWGGTWYNNQTSQQAQTTQNQTQAAAASTTMQGLQITDLVVGTGTVAQNGDTVTVNYVVVNANTNLQTGGPYSVQFGIGPLPIEIENMTSDPDPTTVPEGGQIAFSADAKYGISWTINGQSANVWSPQPSTIAAGQNSAQTALPGANGNSLTYTLSDSMGIRGGGTVKIGT